jgi:transcription elongation factor GreB
MSKAFTKDDDSAGELLVVPRAPLPEGVPNYVTRRGLGALHAEQVLLERERTAIESTDDADRVSKLHALAQRLTDLQARIASARVVDSTEQPHDRVRFGATVQVRSASGKEQSYQIVGVDEADAASGRIAFSSPLARALLGKRTGESAEVRTPRASEELDVIGISYDEAQESSEGPKNSRK